MAQNESKPKDWYSRRHESRTQHDTAVEKYKSEHGRDGRKLNAEFDKAEREKLGPNAQLEQLDHRLGAGVGAKKERARLLAQLKMEN